MASIFLFFLFLFIASLATRLFVYFFVAPMIGTMFGALIWGIALMLGVADLTLYACAAFLIGGIVVAELVCLLF